MKTAHRKEPSATAVLLVVIGGLLTFSCSGQLVRRHLVEELNEGYAKDTFRARQDISVLHGIQKEVLFPKGTQLRVWLEGRADWLKLRAYRAETPREQARGAAIIYIFVEDLPPENGVAAENHGAIREYLALKRLVEGLADNLEPLDQKAPPKRR